MITFSIAGSKTLLTYDSDGFSSAKWLDEKLSTHGEVTLARTFTLQRDDVVSPATQDDEIDVDEDTVRTFAIGVVEDGYHRIRKDILGLKHDLMIATSVPLRRQTFIAERDISIFRRIDELIDEQIVVGGQRETAIPEEEFARLLHSFPTSTELRYYAHTRVTRVLGDYLPTMADSERRLAAYMDRRARRSVTRDPDPRGRIPVATELELQKFTYVRERLDEMLSDSESYSEADWQKTVADLFLLIFPQYVAVLHSVRVKERYSKTVGSTDRFIDLLLVAANGCVDIIEIKKPFARSLVSKRTYRDNHVPVRVLSGAIMQAEKYLFYLSKSGRQGEIDISTKYAAALPAGLQVRVANPKAIILSGRDNDFSLQEGFDFEFVRRSYSNVTDVISYDDLLRRLDNIIVSLKARTVANRIDDSQP